ncbi:Histone-binding protein RBBP4, N-terminal [Trema orientale]|uniref:Histone-binding protein RBBP4, N-terminal n=1 Tax=Trema orientale TaxID=63057 RepID=A0A2P5EWS7_TREOI|nr:Histone-binding protein RBBP4, N-terminal [Trema orientale]
MTDSDNSLADENPRIQSEYNEWKKKCPFFYGFIISHPLPRTSPTVHWSTMTPLAHPQDQSLALHGLLFNSYYQRTRTSYLSIANAPLPVPTMDDGPFLILPKLFKNPRAENIKGFEIGNAQSISAMIRPEEYCGRYVLDN